MPSKFTLLVSLVVYSYITCSTMDFSDKEKILSKHLIRNDLMYWMLISEIVIVKLAVHECLWNYVRVCVCDYAYVRLFVSPYACRLCVVFVVWHLVTQSNDFPWFWSRHWSACKSPVKNRRQFRPWGVGEKDRGVHNVSCMNYHV